MPESIRVARNGAIATVILHRPAVRNAVDPPTATALAQACLSLDRDPEIRALVLWGEGASRSRSGATCGLPRSTQRSVSFAGVGACR